MFWIAMSYNIPIRPSKARVYVWRKLREMGANYFKQGVAILPYTKINLFKIRVLSVKIKDMGGETSIVELRFLDQADETRQILEFKKQSEKEFREILIDFAKLYEEAQDRFSGNKEEYDRIRRRYLKAKGRDFFGIEAALDLEDIFREILLNFKKGTEELYRVMFYFLQNR